MRSVYQDVATLSTPHAGWCPRRGGSHPRHSGAGTFPPPAGPHHPLDSNNTINQSLSLNAARTMSFSLLGLRVALCPFPRGSARPHGVGGVLGCSHIPIRGAHRAILSFTDLIWGGKKSMRTNWVIMRRDWPGQVAFIVSSLAWAFRSRLTEL